MTLYVWRTIFSVSRLFKFSLIFLFAVFFISGCARAPRRVPPPPVPSGVQQSAGFYHTVMRGQNLYRIAKKYNVDWHQFMEVNRISDPSSLEVGQQIYVPQISSGLPQTTTGPMTLNQIKSLVGPTHTDYPWHTITLHHSGTLQGNANAFHRNHLSRQMGGLFYHFVIGNGNGSRDGVLEVGWRWKEHVKANRPNDIQICLVGDFNRQEVSEAQLATLLDLIQALREKYNIPTGGIRKHEDLQGKHTECPGRHFPFSRVVQESIKRDTFAASR